MSAAKFDWACARQGEVFDNKGLNKSYMFSPLLLRFADGLGGACRATLLGEMTISQLFMRKMVIS